MKRVFGFLFFIFFASAAVAQNEITEHSFSSTSHEHEHEHEHEHGRNEIAVSVGPSYSFQHKEWRASAHIHYFRTLSPESRWAIGGGFESIFGEGPHYNLSAGVSFAPIPHIHMALMPGINFTKEEHDHAEVLSDTHTEKLKLAFALHAEVVADLLLIGPVHLGPTFDFSWSKGHTHIMPGLHTAYSF